jgi:hypothetical protein
MTPVTATPMALPTCWAVDSAPDTDPAVAGLACDKTVVVSGVRHSPCPAPSSSSPGMTASSGPPVPQWLTASSRRPLPRAPTRPPAVTTPRPNRTVSAGAGNEVSR